MKPTTVTIGDRDLDLLELEPLPPHRAAALQRLVADPGALDRLCRGALARSLEDGGAAHDYVTHHRAEIAELAKRFADSPAGARTFLAQMHVRSVWSAGGTSPSLVHVDYTIDAATTQYVLSVALDDDGAVVAVDMES